MGHRLSGGYAGSDHGLFTNAACERKFVEVWQHMARRYKDSKAVLGYDLANEPVESAAGDGSNRLATPGRASHQGDPGNRGADRTIIVEPPEWGDPQGLRELRPLAIPNVVYSVHMYLPHAFTHQGSVVPAKGTATPARSRASNGTRRPRSGLKPVVDFQRGHGVDIYIGEFSAIRWARTAAPVAT